MNDRFVALATIAVSLCAGYQARAVAQHHRPRGF
jgi:hypothetical protein